MEFRIEIAIATIALTGPHAVACKQACALNSNEDPRRVTWTEGRKRYDRKGVTIG